MARKGGSSQKRQRNQQRAMYDELDKYPVMPPHAFARIVRDKRTLNIIYQIIEPPLNKKEQEWRDELLDIFIRSLTANIEEIDADPTAYLRTAMDKVIKAYGMKINKKSKSKILEIEKMGGAMKSIEAGFQQREIHEAAWEHLNQVESGDED